MLDLGYEVSLVRDPDAGIICTVSDETSPGIVFTIIAKTVQDATSGALEWSCAERHVSGRGYATVSGESIAVLVAAINSGRLTTDHLIKLAAYRTPQIAAAAAAAIDRLLDDETRASRQGA
jgi:hypothetical protein